jgi:hypothetical protein
MMTATASSHYSSPSPDPSHSPALASRRGIGKYPPLSHPAGRAPPLQRERQWSRYPPSGRKLTGISQTDRLTCRTVKRSGSGAGAEQPDGRVKPVGRLQDQDNLQPAKRRPPPNASEGVAGVERSRTQVNLPQGEPSIRAGASRGRCPKGQNQLYKYT